LTVHRGIRESFQRGASMDDAITEGIKSSAGAVTSAAIVMVGVFSIFGTLSMLMFKQFGVGLAAAILIDATIVRGVLLRATMKLLGERNWYLPGWLQWLPRVEPEERPRPRRRNRLPLRRSPLHGSRSRIDAAGIPPNGTPRAVSAPRSPVSARPVSSPSQHARQPPRQLVIVDRTLAHSLSRKRSSLDRAGAWREPPHIDRKVGECRRRR
jgi:MMPL family protein